MEYLIVLKQTLGTREKSISPCISIITASFDFGRETAAGGAPKVPGSGELGQLFLSLFLLPLVCSSWAPWKFVFVIICPEKL